MLSRRLCLLVLLGLVAAPVAAQVTNAVPLSAERAAQPRPQPRPSEERRCAPGGDVCIAERTYAADLCRAIEAAAGAEGLDLGFFARLLWRESLFDASAISPAGAQGIAQFMPGTAALRGLADPFNPAEAILASADYLRELERRFGSLGLAAVAYNAGEERAARFLGGDPWLPGETRAYVLAITGHPAEAWRDGSRPRPDLRLDKGRPFQEACLARAEGRGVPSLAPEAPALRPWAVILAAQGSREAAERQAGALGALVAGERVDHVRMRVPGAGSRHVAQVGRDTRAEALALCNRLRAGGAACMVLRN